MKKIIGLLLVLTMIISVLPLGVYAAEATEENLVLRTGTKFKSLKAMDSWASVPQALTGGQNPVYYAVNKTETAGEGRKYAWLAYDFGISCQLTKIEIINNTTDYGSIHCAIVEASNHEDFTDCVELGRTATTAYGSKAVVEIPVTGANKYRYVRVRKDSTADWSAGNLIVDDVNVYGYYSDGNLEVVGSNITNGQTNVTNINGIDCITIDFNMPIKTTTIDMGIHYNEDSIFLTYTTTGRAASGVMAGAKTSGSRDDLFLTNRNSTLNIPINHLESNCSCMITINATKMASETGKKLSENYVLNFTTGEIKVIDLPKTTRLVNVLAGKQPKYTSTTNATTSLTDRSITNPMDISNSASKTNYVTFDLGGMYKIVKFEFYYRSDYPMQPVALYGSNEQPTGTTPDVSGMELLCQVTQKYNTGSGIYHAAHHFINTENKYRYITVYNPANNFRPTEICLLAEVDTLSDKFGCDTTPVEIEENADGDIVASTQLINTTSSPVTVEVPNLVLAVYNDADGAQNLVAVSPVNAQSINLEAGAMSTVTVEVPAAALDGKNYTGAKLIFLEGYDTLTPYCTAREAVFEN